MARLYADEDFSYPVVQRLRQLGHDIVTAQESGQVNQSIADERNVCHREGSGTYHLISIAEPAYPTHVAHGDAQVGEPVPDQPGFVFDADCNLVEVVSCPCDFSASNFEALGGNPEIAAYKVSSPTQASLHNPAAVVFMVSDTSCSIESAEIFESLDISASEAEACVLDIQATAVALDAF